MSQWPTVVESVGHKQQLHDNVDRHGDSIQKVEHDEQAHRVGRAQSPPRLEGHEGDDEGQSEHDGRANSDQPDRKGGAIFVQLKPYETVDQQACAESGCEATLNGYKVWEGTTSWRHDTRIDNECENGECEIDIEEGNDFLAA